MLSELNNLYFKPNYYYAFILIVIHYSIILLPIIGYFKTESLILKQVIIIYMLMIGLINIYFKGCPLIRIERKLLNHKSWIGIHEYLRVMGIKSPSKRLIELITILGFIIIFVAFYYTY